MNGKSFFETMCKSNALVFASYLINYLDRKFSIGMILTQQSKYIALLPSILLLLLKSSIFVFHLNFYCKTVDIQCIMLI